MPTTKFQLEVIETEEKKDNIVRLLPSGGGSYSLEESGEYMGNTKYILRLSQQDESCYIGLSNIYAVNLLQGGSLKVDEVTLKIKKGAN
jgi:hypothetical protein